MLNLLLKEAEVQPSIILNSRQDNDQLLLIKPEGEVVILVMEMK